MTVAPYKDGVVTNDHSYYGRGCKNSWGTDGEGGSQTPCADSDAGGRYVKTADNETQKNGTYYNFQAATVGAGGAMATDKTDSPYTFCPLGWQLPYSGTGGDYDDKSKTWNICLSHMVFISETEQLQTPQKSSHIHFPTSTLATTSGILVACTTRVTMAATGPLP